MRAIITRQNADGTYDEVGMNNKALISHLKTIKGIKRWAKEYAKGKTHRIELWHGDNIYVDPNETFEVKEQVHA